jgi:transposase
MNFLTEEKREHLRRQHKQERDGRIRDRIKALLLYDVGWSPQQIAYALLISDQAVRNHIEEYIASNKLKPENGGSEEKLTERQSYKLEAHLQKHTYLYIKDILAYVKVAFNVTYTVPGLRNWLQRHGFSYKKPAVVPGKANKEQQQAWLDEYQKLRQDLPENETICFIDGVHPTHNVQPAYGWIKTGERKEIPTNTGRTRVNLSGSMDVITHRIIIQEDKTLNAEATIRFFQKIAEAYPNKDRIHVFCDNAPYYRNAVVKNYLQTTKIVLHFLPPYSPNLNPIERLWKWMKERVIYNTYYEHFEAFKKAIFGFFAVLSIATEESAIGQTLRMRIRDKFRLVNSPLTTSR